MFKNTLKALKTLSLILSALYLCVAPSLAFAKDGKFEYRHTMLKEKTVKQEDGSEKTTLEEVKRTLPGEELIGVFEYKYLNDEKAEDVVFSLPLRKEFVYVEGSATDEKYVWFSTDDGKTYSRFKDLKVKMKSGAERVATGNDVTNLQWRMAKPLNKGDTGKLRYHVIVK